MNILQTLADELNIPLDRLTATVDLLDAGNTVPFVARYRKEVTGGLDDTVLRNLMDRLTALRNLEKRKDEVRALIEAQGKLTEDVVSAIDAALTVTEVDDIYRPFRPKRKTRASAARERGLEPLASLLTAQEKVYSPSIEKQAEAYINAEKGVETVQDALQGAMDIIAEEISDNADYRKEIRAVTMRKGTVVTRKQADNPTFEQYYEYSEPAAKIPPHRVLAVNRGEKEEALSVSVDVDKDLIVGYLLGEVIKNRNSPAVPWLTAAVEDSYDRLI
ncbi:MAG: RNA-binding transcriptional accessory protein, partial [Clostridia bacterium]|nr:RNA-binding transcriptional accessory protein [Clostridia bacterium]